MKAITFGVHFLIRNNRMDKKGLFPIYSKININGQILKISTNQLIKIEDWNNETELPKQTCKNFKSINNTLEAFKSRIYQAYSKIIATDEVLTAENLKAAFYGKPVEEIKVYTLIETFKEHNKYFESMIGVKYSYGSYKNYKTTLKYLIEFFKAAELSIKVLLSIINRLKKIFYTINLKTKWKKIIFSNTSNRNLLPSITVFVFKFIITLIQHSLN